MTKRAYCALCGNDRGTRIYDYTSVQGYSRSNYFHPDCYRKYLTKIGKRRDEQDT